MNDQQILIDKILANALSNNPSIAVYQRNRWALAERALAISYPTVQQLLGEGFTVLARKFLLAVPNTQADWGAWGESLPNFINTTPLANSLVYLSDCAALDWNIHLAQRATSAADFANLALLQEAPLHTIQLQLNDTVKLISSRFPLYAIWKMHQDTDNTDYWTALANQGLAAEGAATEYLMVFRTHWRATVLPISASEYSFMQQLLNNSSLELALNLVADADFNFTQWLLNAAKHQWIAALSCKE